MEKVVNEYRVFVVGLFGRNRSVKREGFSLVELPVDQALLNESDLDKLVAEKIASIKLKYGTVSVNVNEVTYKNEYGFESKEYMPFSAKTLKTYKIEKSI